MGLETSSENPEHDEILWGRVYVEKMGVKMMSMSLGLGMGVEHMVPDTCCETPRLEVCCEKAGLDMLSEVSETFHEVPKTIHEVPETFHKVPETFRKILEMFRDTLELDKKSGGEVCLENAELEMPIVYSGLQMHGRMRLEVRSEMPGYD